MQCDEYLRIKFRLGLFEKPYADEALERSVVLNAANVTAAREVAARSLVLLKNERNTLPLNKNVKSIAVIGPLADDPKAMLGSWAGDGKAADTVTLLGGIKAKVPGARILHAKGVAIEGRGVTGNYDASTATGDCWWNKRRKRGKRRGSQKRNHACGTKLD